MQHFVTFFEKHLLAGLLVSVFCCSFASGCRQRAAEGFERTSVSGTVQFDGKALPYGVIRFIPTDGAAVPASAADIRAGEFKSERGLLKGTYRVEITGYEQSPDMAASLDAASGPPANQQIVPEQYNIHSTLTLDVGSDAVQEEFNLTKSQNAR